MKTTTYNRKIRLDNTSGVTGVWWRCLRNRWAVDIKVKNKKIYLGQFIHKTDAIQRRIDAEYYFNFFRRGDL